MTLETKKILAISQSPLTTIQPPSDNVMLGIFHKIRELCQANLGGETNVILTADLAQLLERIEQIRKLARHKNQKLAAVTEQIANHLLSSGAIIRTNCESARYIFDESKFKALIRAATAKKELVLKDNLQTRLEKLMNITDDKNSDAIESITKTDSLSTLAPITPREIVATTVSDSLTNLADKFPALVNICRELANLTEAAGQDNLDQLQTCVLSLGEQLHALINNVEDAALEMLASEQPAEKIVEKVVEKIIEVPAVDSAALVTMFSEQHQLLLNALEKITAATKPVPPPVIIPEQKPATSPGLSAELPELEKEKTKLNPAFEALREAEEDARDLAEEIAQEIEHLCQQIRFGQLNEKETAQANLTIEELKNRKKAVQLHLNQLELLRQPIENGLHEIIKRSNVIRLYERPFVIPKLEIPEIPELTISAPPLSPMITPPPTTAEAILAKPPSFKTNSEQVKPQPSDSSSLTMTPQTKTVKPPTKKNSASNQETNRPEDFYNQLAIVAFLVCGTSKLPAIVDALTELKILSDADDHADFTVACHDNPLLTHTGAGTFQLNSSLQYAPWMDEVISPENQKALCRLVNPPPEDLTSLERYIIATVASFGRISARRVQNLLCNQKLIRGKEVLQIQPTCEALAASGEIVSQSGMINKVAIYKIKHGILVPWRHSILSLGEEATIHTHYEFLTNRKKAEIAAKQTTAKNNQ